MILTILGVIADKNANATANTPEMTNILPWGLARDKTRDRVCKSNLALFSVTELI